jgi:hypothetical protein
VQQYTSFSCIWGLHFALDSLCTGQSQYLYAKWKALSSWIFLFFTSFWRNSDSHEYKNKSTRRGAQFVPIGMPTTCNNSRFAEFLPLIYPPELEVKETTDTASSASFLDLYLEFDDSGQISTTFSLWNPSFIIFSAETEYISTRSWYRNINFLRDRIKRIFA